MKAEHFQKIGASKATLVLRTEIDTGEPFERIEADLLKGIVDGARPTFEANPNTKLARARQAELAEASRRTDGLEARLQALRSERKAAELLADDGQPLAPKLLALDRQIHDTEQQLQQARAARNALGPVVKALQANFGQILQSVTLAAVRARRTALDGRLAELLEQLSRQSGGTLREVAQTHALIELVAKRHDTLTAVVARILADPAAQAGASNLAPAPTGSAEGGQADEFYEVEGQDE